MCVCMCSDVDEPSGSDAAEDLIEEMEDDDEDLIDLLDEEGPVATGGAELMMSNSIYRLWLT